MKLNQEIKNTLAAEYVLGTLRGKARQRFQAMMMQSQALREQTWQWEQHLNEMGSQLEPVNPPPRVWSRIQQQLGFEPMLDTSDLPPASNDTRFWPALSLLASAALVILAVLFIRYEPVAPQYTDIAIFNNEAAEPVWLLEISDTAINVRATDSLQQRATNDYQLWIVAKDGRPPISLGLLPKDGSMQLAKQAIFEQVEIAALAVSLEPLGGSPNGLPTEVLYTTQLITL